ncbi:alpha/beta fold hydrolase [Micromonospora sp. NPDC048930]|uniref:alpha/beta fold hydrolase n=1 Tax=Micromonospora sp. NPDC048930 TaxID=3364261 RepID=UPI003721683C
MDHHPSTFVLVHGAWHGGWAWGRVVPLLRAAGAHVIAPDLTHDRDIGLRTHVDEVVAALDAVPGDREVVLVGHSYAGLVVREAADRRAERVGRIVLVDGWAGVDGASMSTLAPAWFTDAVRASAQATGDGWRIPAPDPAAFGIEDPADAAWLRRRLRPQPLRTFTESTRLTAAVDRIPGTGVYCRPQTFPFADLADALGYHLVAVDGPHDVMLTHPETLAAALLAEARRRASG